jgi:catechol 2,3-dioxygenase-like lactoylglutathione lyase family enzyme
MPLKQMHHHGFTVGDLTRSIQYYRDVLGLELIRESDRSNLPSYDHMLGFKDVKLRVGLLKDTGGNLLELFQYVNPPSTPRELKNNYIGSSHVAFEVENIDETYVRLKQHGYGAIAPPVDVIRDGKKVARGIYALDPDGISVEMFQEFHDVVAR